MRERIATLHQEFERIVEAGCVRLTFIRNRPELGDVITKQIGGDRRLTRSHPVHIATQRVDFAVMRDHAVRMGQRPSRESIGREALVNERDRRFQTRILEIKEVIAELGGEQHALVDERTRRQRHGIETLGALVIEIVDGVRDHLAQQEQFALESFLVGRARTTTNENLLMHGLGRLDAFAKTGRINRHIAPAQECLAFIGHDLFNNRFDDLATFRIARQEQSADGVIAFLGQSKAETSGFFAQETIWNLHEHAATIARFRVRADSAAMIEVQKNLKTLGDNVMRLAIVHIGDEANAAGIFFICRRIKAMRFGQA